MSEHYGDPRQDKVTIFEYGPGAGNIISAEYIRADLVTQWMPIETAPKYAGNGHPWILVYNAMAKIVEMKLADGDWWRNMSKDCPHTHWQPLPTPPPAT